MPLTSLFCVTATFFLVGNSFPEICAQMVSTDARFEDHV